MEGGWLASRWSRAGTVGAQEAVLAADLTHVVKPTLCFVTRGQTDLGFALKKKRKRSDQG